MVTSYITWTSSFRLHLAAFVVVLIVLRLCVLVLGTMRLLRVWCLLLLGLVVNEVLGQEVNQVSLKCSEALEAMKTNVANVTHPLSIALRDARKTCEAATSGYYDKCLFWGKQYCTKKYACRADDKSYRTLRTTCVEKSENFFFKYTTNVAGVIKNLPAGSGSTKGAVNIDLQNHPACFPVACLTEPIASLQEWIRDEADNYVKAGGAGNTAEISIVLDLDYPLGLALFTYLTLLMTVFVTGVIAFVCVGVAIDMAKHKM